MDAILFDFDDTLGDREVSAYRYYRGLLSAYLAEMDDVTAECVIQDCLIAEQHGNANKRDVQNLLERKYGIHLDFDLNEYWNDHFYKYYELFEDTEDVLSYLHGRYKLGIITNGSALGQGMKLQKTGVEKWFDTILISGKEGVAKPDPEIFHRAAERLGVPEERCVFVGDTFSNDIQGALKAGMDAVWFWPHGKRCCAYPVKRITSLSDLKKMY